MSKTFKKNYNRYSKPVPVIEKNYNPHSLLALSVLEIINSVDFNTVANVYVFNDKYNTLKHLSEKCGLTLKSERFFGCNKSTRFTFEEVLNQRNNNVAQGPWLSKQFFGEKRYYKIWYSLCKD